MVVAVVVDTSFLPIPAEFGIDVFAESKRVLERSVEFILLTSVLQEIGTRTKSGGSPRDRKFLIASNLAKRCRTVTIDSSIAGLPVDDQLLEYTRSIKGILATNDRRLRERGVDQRHQFHG